MLQISSDTQVKYAEGMLSHIYVYLLASVELGTIAEVIYTNDNDCCLCLHFLSLLLILDPDLKR